MKTLSTTPWHCGRCGQYAHTRKERRLHKKCPPPQLERVQRAISFQDPEFVAELLNAVKEKVPGAREMLLQQHEANADFKLLKKQYDNEVARMAEQGLHLDGTPIEPETTEEIIPQEEV